MIYETEEDRENERRAIARIAKAMRGRYEMFPRKFGIDAFMVCGTAPMLIEYKRRNISRYEFDDLCIDKEKIDFGYEMAKILGMAYWLAIEWDDSFAMINIPRVDRLVVTTLAPKRGDKPDPVYAIPVRLKGWKEITA